MICERWDVVVVPFPFTDRTGAKRRPALTLSAQAFNQRGHTVLAMITSTAHHAWPGDTALEELDAAGLRQPCIVRLKIFTLDNRLLASQLGALSATDRRHVERVVKQYLWSGRRSS